jgi:hypothetical protein
MKTGALQISWIITISVVVLLSGWVLIVKWHGLEEPLERDLTTYAYIAHSLIDGQELYTDLWDHKPPGIFLLYMLAEIVGGYDQHSIVALGIVFTILAGIFLYLFLAPISDAPTALLGTAFWVLASNSVALQGNQPNVELFLNTFTFMALWALGHWDSRNFKFPLLAGIFFAMAAVLKTIIVFPVFFICLYYFYEFAKNYDHYGYKKVVGFFACLLAPSVIMWLGVFAYFGLRGRFAGLWEAVFEFNRYYAGSISRNVWRFFTSPERLVSRSLTEILILVLLALILFGASRKQYGPFKRVFFILLFFGLCFEVASPGYGYPHYYQLLLPVYCILPALFCYDLRLRFGQSGWQYGRSVVGGLIILSLTYLGYFQALYLTMTPYQISHKKYGNLFTRSYEVADEVKRMTAPDDAIYEWGSETGIYYYSKRNAISGITYVYPLLRGSKAERTKKLKRVVTDINRSPPEVFVYNERYGKLKNNIFYGLLKQDYQLVKKIDSYYIFKKRPLG